MFSFQPLVVGGDVSAGVHAALAGQHGDGVAEGDVAVSEEAPLAAAVLVESGEGPGMTN